MGAPGVERDGPLTELESIVTQQVAADNNSIVLLGKLFSIGAFTCSRRPYENKGFHCRDFRSAR